MADNDPAAAAMPTSNMGGARVPGNLNDSQQKKNEAALTFIKTTWKVDDVYLAFPPAIRPKSLGITAIANIRSIARYVPNLVAAQALFLAECKNSSGQPVAVGFSHTSRIATTLREGAATASTPTAGTTGTPMSAPDASTSKDKAKSEAKPKRSKTVVPQDIPALINPATDTRSAPFSISANAPSKLLSFSDGEEELKYMVPKKRALAKSSNNLDNENDGNPIRKKSKKSSENLDNDDNPLGKKSKKNMDIENQNARGAKKDASPTLSQEGLDFFAEPLKKPKPKDKPVPFSNPADVLTKLENIMSRNKSDSEKVKLEAPSSDLKEEGATVDDDGDTIVVSQLTDDEASRGRASSESPATAAIINALNGKQHPRSHSPTKSKAPKSSAPIAPTALMHTPILPNPGSLLAAPISKPTTNKNTKLFKPVSNSVSTPKSTTTTNTPIGPSNFEKRCSKLPDILRDFLKPDSLGSLSVTDEGIANEVKTALEFAARHLEADLRAIFKKGKSDGGAA